MHLFSSIIVDMFAATNSPVLTAHWNNPPLFSAFPARRADFVETFPSKFCK
jgi:hypothetical protein